MALITEEHFQIQLSKLQLSKIITISGETPFNEVIKLMLDKNIGSVIIGSQNNIEGIFTERDIISRLDLILENRDRPICELMTPEPCSLSSDTELVDAMTMMSSKEFRHIPIVDGENIYMLSIKDILHYIVRLCESKLINVNPITDWGKNSVNLDERNILVMSKFSEKCLSTQFLDVALRRIYTAKFSIVDSKLTILETLRLLAQKGHSVGLVMQYQTELVGIVTERDFLTKAFGEKLDLNSTITDIATPDPHLLSRDHTFAHAAKNMFSYNYRNVPIVNQECFPIGNISLLELLIFFCGELGFRRIKPLD